MLNATLLLGAIGPLSQVWSPTIAIVMTVASLLGVAIASTTKKAGPTLVGGLTIAQLLGGTSFGHLLGVGAVLGLTRLGII
ncbi:photosystem I reaction center subunit PsaK [Chamaesiphon sp. GL140_3_metabinner_50]|uniref:photosystem I reaction center subunit PsaK n=1 Tax=Chamaesiphon sp. GL140_3_metabinner_50 TaxID=2970812 RepID=UPI0025DB8499|nr:photosystem I reaction center subunit PsaK [Chamaesiphon sp. GL140_3_metabinner_50]